jgi:hypothetical protein
MESICDESSVRQKLIEKSMQNAELKQENVNSRSKLDTGPWFSPRVTPNTM